MLRCSFIDPHSLVVLLAMYYNIVPYCRYRNDMMTRRTNRPTLVGTRSQSPAAQASASSQLSHQSTFHQSPPSLPTQPPHRLSSQLPGRNLATAGIATPVLPPRSSVFNSSVGVPVSVIFFVCYYVPTG